jgi:uncharacterized membrane protein (UPF0127 family)
MSKKKDPTDKTTNKQTGKHKMRIGILFAVIATALIIIFMPKKTEQDISSANIAPMFNKQGELTFARSDGKKIVSIDIEIADNDKKREIGLMGRPVMDELQGMLFVFEQEHMASFWMKNTILPLDMIFVNKTGEIVTICRNTTPFSEQSYSATAFTLFVVEVNAGFTDKYGIKEGDTIIWKRL